MELDCEDGWVPLLRREESDEWDEDVVKADDRDEKEGA